MNRNFANDLVKNTFEQGFDRDRFYRFIKELLNKFDESKAFRAHGYVKEKFKKTSKIVKTYERLGTYIDSDNNKIDILIVYLEKNGSLDRARTSLRNFIADYLIQRGVKDAALAAFVSPNKQDWRFSLVKMEYRIDTNGKKLKTKRELTPARRFSFLVGPEEHTHTAQSRLSPIIEDDVNNPTLKELEDAFSVETVTKEFFEKYHRLYLSLKEYLDKFIKNEPPQEIKKEFEAKRIDTTVFCKKLLGQIVFLYFLQKKGWLGAKEKWGDGDKKFLRNLFTECKQNNGNFFNDYLEYLYYDALNNENRGGADPSIYPKFNCKIPFLNGGLFNEDYNWKNTDIKIGNELFSDKKDGDNEGNGILDVFDLYNFTVKEDEPLEKEVAVDPEMLGKVFENLLEVKDRKSKGTYYTPREIVHYMCQESLINYLVNECEGKVEKENLETLVKYGETFIENEITAEQKKEDIRQDKQASTSIKNKLSKWVIENSREIDNALGNIKVCDPAVGSGAFLVGMMNEIIRMRNTLKNYLEDKKDRSIYSFKRDAIQNSLYGVDIDQSAVEIAKLRLWLSLVVDEEDIKQIKPLPNLDYKIMQGNSLLEEFEGVRLFDEELISKPSLDDDEHIKTLKQRQSDLQHEFIKLYSSGGLNHSKKQELEMELKKVSDSLKKLTRPDKPKSESGNLFDIFSEAKKKAQELKQLHKEFFEASQKTKKDELKRRIEKLEWELIETSLSEQNKTSSLKKLEQYKKTNIKPFFLWRLNFAEVFQEKGGFDVVIANPPYISAWSMEKEDPEIRKIIKNALSDYRFLSGHWDLYIAFVAKGHQLLKEHGSLAYIVPNPILREKYATDTRKFLLQNMKMQGILEFNDVNVFDNVSRRTTVIVALKKQLTEDYPIYIFSNQNDHHIVTLLNTFDKSYWLNQPKSMFLIKGDNKNEAVITKLESQSDKIGNFFYVNYGVQVSSKEKGKFGKSEVVGDQPKGDAKEFYEGKDVQRWQLRYRNLWLDYREKDLYGPRAKELFERDKLVLRKVSDKGHKLAATLDVTGRFTDDGNVLIVPYKNLAGTDLRRDFKDYTIKEDHLDLRYILAMILSKIESFYFSNRFATESLQGSTSHTYPASVRALIVKPINDEEQKPFIDLVDKIINLQQSSLGSDKHKVADYERQINELFYTLYSLTSEEIAVVEGKNEN